MSSRLKVLHAIGGGGYGGREKMLHALMIEEKKDPHLMSSAFLLMADGVLIDDLKKSGMDVVTMRRFSNWRWYQGIRFFADYDLVVCHTADWRLMLFCALSGRPVIYRLSGLYLLVKKSVPAIIKNAILRYAPVRPLRESAEQNLKVAHSTSIVSPWRSIIRLYRRWQFMVFLRYFCERVIVNSRYSAENVRRQYRFPDHKRIDIIPNGIREAKPCLETNDKIRRQYGIQDSDFVLGTVARFDVRKRIDRLLEGVLPLRGELQFKLMIVGDGDADLSAQFREYVRREGLDAQVIFTGFVRNPLAHIQAMDFFVLSSDNESFPNALMEAMLLGRVCAAFCDGGGAVELIEHGVTGYLIKTCSEIAGLAIELRSSQDVAQSIGARASRHIVEQYSMETYAGQYAALYRSVTGI